MTAASIHNFVTTLTYNHFLFGTVWKFKGYFGVIFCETFRRYIFLEVFL